MTRDQLEQRIRSGIPLSAQMDFRVVELSESAIRVRAGADENINVHGTAFAGSLYAVCTLALWGLIHSRLPRHASLVMAQGTIDYLKPVVGDIVAECDLPLAELRDFLDTVRTRGKGRLQATVTVPSSKGPAAAFTGTVYARLNPKTP